MPTARDQMFANFIVAGADKPILKCNELDVGRVYDIVGISKLSSGHKSIILECEEFKFYLPSIYKSVQIVDLEASDNYAFTIDKVIKLNNGLFTCLLSFFKDGKKIC